MAIQPVETDGTPARRDRYGLQQDARGNWRCDFYAAGQRIQRTTGTTRKAEAREACAAWAMQAWRAQKLEDAPRITWEQAVADWFRAKERAGKRDLVNDHLKARAMLEYLEGRSLTDPDLGEVITAALDEIQRKRDLSPSTHNKYRSFVRSVLSFARQRWPKLPAAPAIQRQAEPRRDIRILSREEVGKLFACLTLHLRRMARFALATGLRDENVRMLRLEQVDFAARRVTIEGADFKTGKPLVLPLSDEALAVLIEARDCPLHGLQAQTENIGAGKPAYAFTYLGVPVARASNTGWYAALRESKIKPCKWHSLRATWASWHLEAGTPIEVVQRLGGWANLDVLVKHYAHVAIERQAQYAGNIGALPE